MNNELQHHGTPGMKWGVRHGPPYPLQYDGRSLTELPVKSKGRTGKKYGSSPTETIKSAVKKSAAAKAQSSLKKSVAYKKAAEKTAEKNEPRIAKHIERSGKSAKRSARNYSKYERSVRKLKANERKADKYLNNLNKAKSAEEAEKYKAKLQKAQQNIDNAKKEADKYLDKYNKYLKRSEKEQLKAKSLEKQTERYEKRSEAYRRSYERNSRLAGKKYGRNPFSDEGWEPVPNAVRRRKPHPSFIDRKITEVVLNRDDSNISRWNKKVDKQESAIKRLEDAANNAGTKEATRRFRSEVDKNYRRLDKIKSERDRAVRQIESDLKYAKFNGYTIKKSGTIRYHNGATVTAASLLVNPLVGYYLDKMLRSRGVNATPGTKYKVSYNKKKARS